RARGEDVRLNATGRSRREPRASEVCAGEGRAPRFVVAGAELVNRVVEPEREGDLGGAQREPRAPVEPREAGVDVLEGVVVPMGRPVTLDELFEEQVGRSVASRRRARL